MVLKESSPPTISDDMGRRDVLEMPVTLKRKHSSSLPPTPPLSMDDRDAVRTLDRAVHVLSTEATALSHVTMLYQTDSMARDGLLRAVDCVTKVNEIGGRFIICGVGKSGLVGMKIVATMKSLGLGSSFLHPSEAMHGDLGDVRKVCKGCWSPDLIEPLLIFLSMTLSCLLLTPAGPLSYFISCRTFRKVFLYWLLPLIQLLRTAFSSQNDLMLSFYLRRSTNLKRSLSVYARLLHLQL